MLGRAGYCDMGTIKTTKGGVSKTVSIREACCKSCGGGKSKPKASGPSTTPTTPAADVTPATPATPAASKCVDEYRSCDSMIEVSGGCDRKWTGDKIVRDICCKSCSTWKKPECVSDRLSGCHDAILNKWHTCDDDFGGGKYRDFCCKTCDPKAPPPKCNKDAFGTSCKYMV